MRLSPAHIALADISRCQTARRGTLFAVIVAAAAVLSVAAAAAARPPLHPGSGAALDVSVATLWRAPNLARGIDRPSLTNPADPAQWSRNLATTASRVWLDARVQTQALYGQQVVVLARRGAWAQVAVVDEPDPQNAHGYPGWLPVSQLAPDFNRRGAPLVVTARLGTLHVDGGTLRLSYGTTLPSLGGDRVRTPDGIGVLAGATRPLTPTNASIIAQARRFLGTHYLWGGLSAWGFDCSGLIWDVYRAHGLTIPRDADPQFHHGTPVARTALRPGDADRADASVSRVAAAPVRERERDEDAADQAADVPADGDVRDREGQDEVDHDPRHRGARKAAGGLPFDDQEGAEDAEDRTRRTERDGKRRQQQRSRGAREAGDEIEREVARTAEVVLDRPADHPERPHVETDVNDVRVQEGGRDQPPPPAVRHVRRVEPKLLVERAARAVDAVSLRGADQVDRDVDRDQHPRCERVGRTARRPAHDPRRSHPPPRPGVFRAAQPHRRRRHAFRADRAAALRAREPGLPVGAPIAGGQTGLGHGGHPD